MMNTFVKSKDGKGSIWMNPLRRFSMGGTLVPSQDNMIIRAVLGGNSPQITLEGPQDADSMVNSTTAIIPDTTTGAGTISSAGITVTGIGGTTFTTDFKIGDTIESGGQYRTVATITSATVLTTTAAFAPVVTGAAYTFSRPIANIGQGTITSAGTTVTGVNTKFTTQLRKGDVILATNQAATVASITSDTVLVTNNTFSPVLAAANFIYQAQSVKDMNDRLTVEIQEMAYRRKCMNYPVLAKHVFGTAQKPFFMKETPLLQGNQTLGLQFQNNSTATSGSVGVGTIVSAGTAVTGTGTTFLADFAPGDIIGSFVGTALVTATVESITSNTALVLKAAFSPSTPVIAGSAYTFRTGSAIAIASEITKYQIEALKYKEVADYIQKERARKQHFQPYWLTLDLTSNLSRIRLAASAGGNAFLTLTDDLYFVAFYMIGSALTDGTAGNTGEIATVALFEGTTKRALQNTPFTINTGLGTSQNPYVFPTPLIVEPRTNILAQFVNLITNGTFTDVFLTLGGVAFSKGFGNLSQPDIADEAKRIYDAHVPVIPAIY